MKSKTKLFLHHRKIEKHGSKLLLWSNWLIRDLLCTLTIQRIHHTSFCLSGHFYPTPTPYTQRKFPEKGACSEIEDLGYLHPNTTAMARGSCLYVGHHLIPTISWDVIRVDKKTEAQGLGWYLSYSSDFITPLLGSGENEMSKSNEIMYPKSHLTFQSILHTLLLLFSH